ncbi:MAG: TetR/AcrR family transcriptional regulator [Candidatus Izimaplasma sp.]|nr:TetR/AcrR family transcriptional regulator [Candidatus Izimaplasma bacterium]
MDLNKKERIIFSAIKLFNKNGFHATPTSKIAKKAKVSVGTLFNYFKTKDDLIKEIYLYIKYHSKEVFLNHLENKPTYHDKLQSMWCAVIQWGIDNPEEFQFLEMFNTSPYKFQIQEERLLEEYNQLRETIIEVITPNSVCLKNPDYTLMYIDNAMHAATRFLLNNHIKDVRSFEQSSFELFWYGFKPSVQ